MHNYSIQSTKVQTLGAIILVARAQGFEKANTLTGM